MTALSAEIPEVVEEDPNDPMSDDPLALVRQDEEKKLKCECGPCTRSKDSRS